MPARKTTYKTGHKPGATGIPPGVHAALVLEAQQGADPTTLSVRYGVDVRLVRRMTRALETIPQSDLRALQSHLPALYAVIAASFGVEAMSLLSQGDAGQATKAMFGSKLAVEAGRLSTPASAQPGTTILAFIGGLGATRLPPGPQPPEVLDVTPVPEIPAAPSSADLPCQNGTELTTEGLVGELQRDLDDLEPVGSVIADLQAHDRAEGEGSATLPAQPCDNTEGGQ